MNILVKRLFAFIIDLLILGCFILILKQFTTIEKLSLKYASLFLLLLFRDFTFKGASIGKKIMRIRIYDSQWNKPSFFLVLKRTCVLIYVNFDTVFHAFFLSLVVQVNNPTYNQTRNYPPFFKPL